MDLAAELKQRIEALEARATTLADAAEAGDKPVEEVKALVNDEIMPEILSLRAEKAEAERVEEMKALKESFGTLQTQIEDIKKPSASEGFVLGPKDESPAEEDTYSGGSWFADVVKGNKNIAAARERLTQPWEGKALDGMELTEEGKAMSEGVAAQGGYLVRPAIERQIVTARELDNKLRNLCSKLNLTTNSISLDQITLATTAGWVAELAVKPETTSMSLATVTANVFTAAGLATISNQLLADSNPAVDGLVTSDLAKRLVALEETAFLTGTGTGQPLGILNTPGIGATALTSTSVAAAGGLLDAVLDAILSVQTNFGNPNAVLMHPRTWTRIIKDRDAAGVYTIDGQTDRSVARPSSGTIFGVPVVLSNRIPTNLGAGTNESRVIVGDFKECLILDRQGITVDESPHVYFTSNQTVFRAEMRVGFTAARTPAALNVIGGIGLVNG